MQDLAKCGLEVVAVVVFAESIVPMVKNSHRIGPPLYTYV